MEVFELQKRAKALGLTCLEGASKGDTIRAIQISEGSRDCCGNLWRYDCQAFDCYWREDCHTPKPE